MGNEVDMSQALEINDGHGWNTVYRNSTNGREVQECRSHEDDPSKGCGIRKYKDTDGSWMIGGENPPWVPDAHVEAHAKARVAKP